VTGHPCALDIQRYSIGMTKQFHLPEIPFSPIDALNRRAAAVGSPRYVDGAHHANYNGHALVLWWNSYRKYYILEYTWNGRQVICRGSFEDCLRAALREYERGALGTSVTISPREDDAEAIALCEQTPKVQSGREGKREWWTWRHEAACESARDYALPGRMTMLFDWPLMQAAESREAYEAALREKHGRVYT